MKKKLCALALGFLGILTMNAQDNLVKNGDFNAGTSHWETNSTSGSIEIDPVNSGKPTINGVTDDRTPLAIKNFKIDGTEYAYQRIEGQFSGKNFDFKFASLAWGTYLVGELEWSTGQTDKVEITDTNGYQWKMDNRLTGQAPIGANWVKVKFICSKNIDSDPTRFLVDDVSLTVSGDAIIPTPLDTPENIEVSTPMKTGFTLSWDAVEKAEGYEVTVNGKTVKVTGTTHDVIDLEAGKKYPVSIKGYSNMTKSIEDQNGVANLEVFTLGNDRADGDDVFFEGGTFRNGDADLNRGWRSNSSVSISDNNVDGNNSTKMRVQNSSTATVARSNDFSVEPGVKYTISAYTHTPDKNSELTLNIVWKKADGQRIATDKVASTKENYNTWESIVNEVTAPQDAVVAEVFFQLPAGQDASSIFYVDDIRVVKGVVAPYGFSVAEKNQRNATLSWETVEGKAYKVVVNGGEPIEANKGMVRVNGLLPNTEYTAEVYSTDNESKKSTVTFRTNDFEQAEGERIAYLSNIDENGVIPQEFFYNISELEGDAIKTVAFVYDELPVQESESGKISLPATEGKKLVVTITQENDNQTVLTYYVVTFKK